MTEKTENLEYQERILKTLSAQRDAVQEQLFLHKNQDKALNYTVFKCERDLDNYKGNAHNLKNGKSALKLAKSVLENHLKQSKYLQDNLDEIDKKIAAHNKAAIQSLTSETPAQRAQRDHEREMKIIDHEIARENRLAAEATAKVAATAQEQASQSIDGLLKGLQGNGEG